MILIYYFPFYRIATGAKALKIRGSRGEGRGRAQRGDNSGIQWGGTETSGYGYYIFFQISFLSVWGCLDSNPLVAFFILETLWLLDETPEEDEGETEKP